MLGRLRIGWRQARTEPSRLKLVAFAQKTYNFKVGL
jgi:hypothetical protein